jgi:transmembrane sensor
MSNQSRGAGGEADWEALARYFAGESSADELVTVRRWLAEHPGEAAALSAADAATRRRSTTAPVVDVDAAWRRMATRLDAPAAAIETSIQRPRSKTYPSPSPGWRIPALRAAAAVLVLAGSAALWRIADQTGAGTSPAAAARVFATGAGQRDSVVLSDGTGVLLGPGSSLRHGADYGIGGRDVHLNGEALFDVPHDNARPFVVHVAGATVHDLGTTFTVRASNGTSGATTVAVTSGAVRVARTAPAPDSGVVLREGDVAVVRPGGPIARFGREAVDDALAFTHGRLVFRDAPLSDVAVTLRRWYGVDVRIADPRLAERTLSGSYDGESLTTVLDAIELVMGAPVERTDGVVTIGRGGASGDSRR